MQSAANCNFVISHRFIGVVSIIVGFPGNCGMALKIQQVVDFKHLDVMWNLKTCDLHFDTCYIKLFSLPWGTWVT